MNIVLCGGGTGGHIFPLVAFVSRFRNHVSDAQFCWIGEHDSLEENIARKQSISFRAIKTGKLCRYFSFRTFFDPLKNVMGFFQSLQILRNIRPELVFSKGGYISLPVALAAKILGIPLFLHESDAIPGLANRMVGKLAQAIFLGFEEAANSQFFPKEKCHIVGQMLNSSFFDTEKQPKRSSSSIQSIVILWGSQGSARLFNFVLSLIPEFPDISFRVILGTKNADFQPRFAKFPQVEIFNFVSQNEMQNILRRTDAAITRAGATSLAELDAMGLSLFIVPLKESANDHQRFNALAYQKNWSTVVEEDRLKIDGKRLFQDFITRQNIVSSREPIDGAELVVNYIVSVLG